MLEPKKGLVRHAGMGPKPQAPFALLFNQAQVLDQAIPALLELKKQGLVRHIGITGLPLNVFRRVLDRLPVGARAALCHVGAPTLQACLLPMYLCHACVTGMLP